MRMNQITSRPGIQQLYYFMVFSLLVGVAIFSVGCNGKDVKPTEENKGTVNPNPTPPPNDDTLGDTPIIISGGSIHLDFHMPFFNACPTSSPLPQCPAHVPATDKLYIAKGEVTTAFVYNDNANNNDPPLELKNVAGTSTITIKCKIPGEDGHIVIKSNGTAKTITIQFSDTKFKPRRPGSHRWTSKSLKVDEITVIDNTGATKTYKNELPQGNKLTIEIQ